MHDATTTDATVDHELDHLFDATLQFRSSSPDDAVVPRDEREGTYIGSGDGVVNGAKLGGTIKWSLFSGNCLYPLIRDGQKVPDNLHVCTLNPGGIITTEDGTRIRFDGKGYGLRTKESYRVSMTMVFSTENKKLDWLTRTLGMMEGEFDEQAGRATWRVYAPRVAG